MTGELDAPIEPRVDARCNEYDAVRLLAAFAGAESAVRLNLQVRNTGITEIARGRSGSRLVAFNSVPHLEQPGRLHAVLIPPGREVRRHGSATRAPAG
jgi:hypothetical protein